MAGGLTHREARCYGKYTGGKLDNQRSNVEYLGQINTVEIAHYVWDA
jgi:hypothetical protein